MRSKLIPFLIVVVLAVIGWSMLTPTSKPEQGEGAALDVDRLTASEVARQARSALDELMASDQPDKVRAAAKVLKSLIAAPALDKGQMAQRQKLLEQLELGRLTWISQHQALAQERESLLAAIHQGDMAMEMLVAPMAGTDAYLGGLYDQYKRYSETLALVSKSLFAAQDAATMAQALQRLQGMAPTAQDNARVLALEIPALRDHAQVKAGATALVALIKPDQGCAARWIQLQQQQENLAKLVAQLNDLLHPERGG